MSRWPALGILVLLKLSPAWANGDDPAALVREKRCDACHDIDKMLIGPSYRAIAARHAADKAVMIDVLAQKIIDGGAGNWGVVPMVPNEHVSFDEARRIARWILNLD